MVTSEATAVRRPRRFRGVGAWTAVVLVGLLGLTLIVLALVKVPYAVMSPGPVTNALGNTPGEDHAIISVEPGKDVKIYEPGSGELYFTTVSVEGGPAHPLSALSYLMAKLDPDAEIKPVDEVFPKDATAQQIEDRDKAMMAESQDGAHIVAARAAGYPVTRTLGIAGVLESSPNKDVLQPGDDLITFAGKRLTTADDLQGALAKATPGKDVKLGIKRDGQARDVTVKIVRKDDRNVMGILVRYQYATPLKASFDAGKVGGPSAGLMFSLALYDKLTPGDLTGGKHIAGTGTISGEGQVGAIGGIQFKVRGARDAGADWFLAPKDNCADLKGHEVAGLHVIPVATFDEAKADVTKIASGTTGGLPSCP